MSKEEEKRGDESSNLLEDLSDPEIQVVSGEEEGENSSSREVLPLIEQCPPSYLKRHCSNSCCCCSFQDFTGWVMTNLLLLLTLVSVIVGTIIGFSVREVNLPQHSNGYRLMVELLSIPGEMFLRMLKMLILPLIVFSLIAGLGSLETKVAGSLGWKTVLYYGTTTFLAVILGLILVNVINPGGRNLILECDNSTHSGTGNELDTLDSILDLIR